MLFVGVCLLYYWPVYVKYSKAIQTQQFDYSLDNMTIVEAVLGIRQ